MWSPCDFSALDYKKKKKWNKKIKSETFKCFQTTSYIYLSIPLYIYLNIAVSRGKHDTMAVEVEGFYLETDITFQNH